MHIGVDPCPMRQQGGCQEDRHRMGAQARGSAHGWPGPAEEGSEEAARGQQAGPA